MIRKRLGRIATVLTSAAMAFMLLGVGTVSAANPTWIVLFDRLPNMVAPGNDAGWLVTVKNRGPSNINDLRVTVTSPDTDAADVLPSYMSPLTLSSGGAYSCVNTATEVVCSVGTVAALGTVTFTVAYAVPTDQTGTFAINVALRAGTGDTGSDGPGKSRGDKITFEDLTPVSQSSNFDGGFVVDELFYLTNQDLGRRNVQATSLERTAGHIGVTIEDGATLTVICDGTADPQTVNPACNRLFGEWSKLNVNDGASYAATETSPYNPFKVTLLVLGSATPGGTSADDIVLVHVLDDGTVDVIGDSDDEICDSTTGTPTNADCITVTKVGSNFQIVAWLVQNGGYRGGL